MAELGMRIGGESFRILNHAFDWLVWSVGSSMVDIDALKLDVKGTNVFSVETDDVLTNVFNFGLFFFLFFPLFSSLFDVEV